MIPFPYLLVVWVLRMKSNVTTPPSQRGEMFSIESLTLYYSIQIFQSKIIIIDIKKKKTFLTIWNLYNVNKMLVAWRISEWIDDPSHCKCSSFLGRLFDFVVLCWFCFLVLQTLYYLRQPWLCLCVCFLLSLYFLISHFFLLLLFIYLVCWVCFYFLLFFFCFFFHLFFTNKIKKKKE